MRKLPPICPKMLLMSVSGLPGEMQALLEPLCLQSE